MNNDDALRLTKLLEPMDVPRHRTFNFTYENVETLRKHLGTRNENHENYPEAVAILDRVFKDYEAFNAVAEAAMAETIETVAATTAALKALEVPDGQANP